MKALKKPLSLLMALLMCFGVFAGTGVTAFAAGETMTTYMVDIPRASDPNKAGWGHPAFNFLGGWSTQANDSFSVHTQDSFTGKAIYCIEPGIGVESGDQYTGRGEDFWDNYPSNLNPTIPPSTIKEYIGRIMTYGWQGNADTSWNSNNPDDANEMAGYIATQLLVWETVVGERDSQFNHVDANAQGKNNVAEYISASHPLRSQIFSQYSAIESAVKRHTMLPSFFSGSPDAGAYELKWDGEKYSVTLTDTNNVLGDYTFTSNTTGLNFSVNGNQLTITSNQAIKGSVTVKAEKITAQRSGVVVWTDGVSGGGTQDFATYGATVSDQMVGYLNLEVKTGNMKLIKTSEDGKVYLHIQPCDAGYDYTIYDKNTMRALDGGQLDAPELPLSTAALKICEMHDLGGQSIRYAPLSMIETLQEAAVQQMQAAAQATAPAPTMLPDAPEQHLDEYPMPDPTLTQDDLEKCGYLDGDLLPLSKERAYELMAQDLTVYMIQQGENPAMAFDTDDLDAHDGIFAVTREEWEESPAFDAQVKARIDHQQEREQAFLGHKGDCFAIYQVKHTDDLRDIRYEGLEWIKSIGRTVQRDNYNLVYTAPLVPGDLKGSVLDNLEYRFNNEHPADYRHPSMSVSDIVAIKRDGKVSCHYNRCSRP